MVDVSTIHKAKGREFDTVYMLLDHVSIDTDEKKRQIYVGLTRAKRALYIHYNNGMLDRFALPEIELVRDDRIYQAPDEITLQLTHKSVVLDFFKEKKELIFHLHSGAQLQFDGRCFLAEIGGERMRVAKCSKACLEQIEELQQKGYCPVAARVRFVLAWRGGEDEVETAVLLPDLRLRR